MRVVFSIFFISVTLLFNLIACDQREAALPSNGGENTVGQAPATGGGDGGDKDQRLAREEEEFWIIMDKPKR